MSRRALTVALALSLAAATAAAQRAATTDPHLDPTLVTGGCAACHVGHGLSRSPMLSAPQDEVCLGCHGSEADLAKQRSRGHIASDLRPPSLSRVLTLPFVHEMTADAFSRREPGAVTCTSCHSPHRGSRTIAGDGEPSGEPAISTRDPARFEYELCQTCHGDQGITSIDLLDISRLLNPSNRSYHPVEAPSVERSPSVVESLAGRQVNCTDCHGAAAAEAPRGVHGSANRYILRGNHPTVDGSAESESTYALCYGCHDRETVLTGPEFPEHDRHVRELDAACATCHNAHGSVQNRALIRFGEETQIAGVSPSIATGRLEYESMSAGSGACYLTCHGYDHAPATYGGGGIPALVSEPWPTDLRREPRPPRPTDVEDARRWRPRKLPPN